jgi:hypothetical protein
MVGVDDYIRTVTEVTEWNRQVIARRERKKKNDTSKSDRPVQNVFSQNAERESQAIHPQNKEATGSSAPA